MSAPIELRAQNPVELLDGALLAVRRGGFSALVPAWAAGSGIALVALAAYFVERVEGIRSLRPLLALGFVGAYGLRALVLSRVARDYVRLLRPRLPVIEPPPSTLDLLSSAAPAALGLYLWLWPLVGLALLSPWAIAAAWPFFAIRGGIAPSWLARASCGRDHGGKAFGQAVDDTAGMRGVFVVVELLALLGTIGVFANAYAVLTTLVLLGHSLLGLDLAFVSSFLSPDNDFVLLLVAATALVLMEPLRAAISAQAFVEARARRDGADLHVAVDELLARAEVAPRRNTAAVGGLLFVIALHAALAPGHARAQRLPDAHASQSSAASPHEPATDRWARERVDEILARPEFRELPEQRVDGLGKLLQDFFDWLRELGRETDEPAPATTVQLPSPPGWLLIGLIGLALVVVLAYVLRNERAARRSVGIAAPGFSVQGETGEPAALLDEASLLAARGEHGAALRALYVATLVALDRRHVLEWVAGKTNGEYLRAMPRGELRKAFAGFTRIFDRVVYGHAAASAEDYARCRDFAERMVQAAPREPPA